MYVQFYIIAVTNDQSSISIDQKLVRQMMNMSSIYVLFIDYVNLLYIQYLPFQWSIDICNHYLTVRTIHHQYIRDDQGSICLNIQISDQLKTIFQQYRKTINITFARCSIDWKIRNDEFSFWRLKSNWFDQFILFYGWMKQSQRLLYKRKY